MTVNYRNAHGLFACAGILFNHESPLRGKEFVTRKITDGVARIKLGAQDRLTLGNLDTGRDWGYAPEYVDAMWRMLQQETAEDYVLATGESHTVREFVAMAFRDAGIALTWEGTRTEERGINLETGAVIVEVSPELFRPTEPDRLIGNATKAKRHLGWTPRVSFADLVQTMVDADLKRVGQAVQYERGPREAYRQ
jgi:GDPmannose 4,6-dehydratase